MLTGALAFLAPRPVVAESAAGAGRSILIVHAEDPYLPWVSEVTGGIYSVLEAAPSGSRPDVYVEHLDLARFPDSEHSRARFDWLQEKYRRQRVDAVIAVTKPALDFILPLVRQLWPGVPIVLVENEHVLRSEPAPPGVIPVVGRFEVSETLDLAKALLPGTRRVAFVNGAPDIEHYDAAKFRKALEARGDRLELIDLEGLPMAELQRRVAALPEDAIVFYWSIRLDGARQPFIPREALRLFAPRSSRPVFSVHGTMIGYGVVGGRVLDYGAIGKEAGNAALGALAGSPPTASAAGRGRPVFDARELRRFRIDASRLPPASEVRFLDQPVWRRYPLAAAAVSAALLIQGALIGALLLERRRRGRAQALSGAALASMPGQVAVLDGDGRIERVNQNWEHFPPGGPAGGVAIGEDYLDVWRRTLGTSVFAPVRGDDFLTAVLRGDEEHGVIEYAQHDSEQERRFEMHVEVLRQPGRGAVVVHVDVTRRHQADSELRLREREIAHLNRVGAVGELASSLAHELGQPLGAILVNAQATRRQLARPSPDLDEVRAGLDDIIEDDQHAGEVIQRMRSLLRKEQTPRESVDLNEIVRNVVNMVAGDASLRRASVAQDLAPSAPNVFGDRVQLKQVVLNLVINGLDAVAERPIGSREVVVSTSASNGRVAIRVSDSGAGIPAADLERVFEPFYTTKRQGIGMGLRISRTIVEAHGGELRAENRAEGGAVFLCAFPAAGGPA